MMGTKSPIISNLGYVRHGVKRFVTSCDQSSKGYISEFIFSSQPLNEIKLFSLGVECLLMSDQDV